MTQIELMQQNAYAIRGRFLETVIQLEKQIEFFIGKHFCRTEAELDELVMVIISPRMGFRDKKDVFDYLVDHYYKSFKNQHLEKLNRLGKIIDWRNMFAHWALDLSDKSVTNFRDNNLISLVKLKNAKNKDGNHVLGHVELFSEDRINDMIKEINETVETMKLLIKIQASPMPDKPIS